MAISPAVILDLHQSNYKSGCSDLYLEQQQQRSKRHTSSLGLSSRSAERGRKIAAAALAVCQTRKQVCWSLALFLPFLTLQAQPSPVPSSSAPFRPQLALRPRAGRQARAPKSL